MRDTITSWATHKFNSDIKIYRADKKESDILKRNIGKIVNVEVHDIDFPKAGPSIFTMKVLQFIKYDPTHESLIDDSEKNWSKNQRQLVPNRFIFRVEAHHEPSPWEAYV